MNDNANKLKRPNVLSRKTHIALCKAEQGQSDVQGEESTGVVSFQDDLDTPITKVCSRSTVRSIFLADTGEK